MKTLKAFLKKYPTANKDAGISINLINLEK
jgi:hypothetical protein